MRRAKMDVTFEPPPQQMRSDHRDARPTLQAEMKGKPLRGMVVYTNPDTSAQWIRGVYF